MKEIMSLAGKIAEAINKNDIYKKYIDTREKVKADSDLYERIREFKEKHIEFQEKILNNSYTNFDEEKYISKLYYELKQNKTAEEYFEAERNVLKLIGSIYTVLATECGI